MAPFGYLFILAGALLIRQVAVGRVGELPDDARDFANALLSGHPEQIAEVMARRGKNVAEVGGSGSVDSSPESVDLSASATPSNKGAEYARKCIALGGAARGYKLGYVGPDYYDCSGLLWQAARTLGIYKGSRFTTSTFTTIAPSWCQAVSSPAIGDIILWAGNHMGVCIGDDEMYSARSPAKGIGKSSISGDSSYFGSQPTYWRIK